MLPMPDRLAHSNAFLQRAGWGDAARSKLAGDASFRKYERLSRDGKPAVLMDAPPPQEDVRPFLRIARHLQSLGYSAPHILAEDADRGFLLLEDLGDDLFARLLEQGSDETQLYEAAIDFLLDLHRHPAPADLVLYDEDRLIAETELFIDWYLPALTGRDTPSSLRQAFRFLWSILAPEVGLETTPGRRILVLRDFHAENLIWLPERQGAARLGLLDFQDAVAGHPAYDLVSLLEDARRDVSPDLAEAMLQRYIAGSGVDDAAFRRAYAILGAQRNIRILGVFTRLWKRDGKQQYQTFMSRMWGLVERDLAHPALTDLRGWLNATVSPEQRHSPLPGLG
ncbi:MAG: phosphotransferase [Ferrovibrio sp.]|uniref:aminoglycoside phosphotransferase family protein n=1 Tax=Ferrovibrio sp. TaxID=1917215 RepID=UPI00260E9955|nr:phosphotransferase [Ferrovibrio sp.]MCW0236235.1 phosphotransferase [Ferrovibrio sp.]